MTKKGKFNQYEMRGLLGPLLSWHHTFKRAIHFTLDYDWCKEIKVKLYKEAMKWKLVTLEAYKKKKYQ